VRCANRLNVELKKKFMFRVNPLSNKKGAIKHPFPTPCTV